MRQFQGDLGEEGAVGRERRRERSDRMFSLGVIN